MPTDWSGGLLPEAVASEVLSTAEQDSAVLSLATTRRMPTGTESLPLVKVQPTASWVETAGGRKAYSEIEWGADRLVASELSLVTFIADVHLADTTWNPEQEIEKELAASIARAFDAASLFGTGAPSGFPPGGLASTPVTGDDAVDALDKALAVVEASGVQPNGIVAGPQVGTAMRQAYKAARALPSEAPAGEIFGLPVRIVPNWDSSKGDAIVGDFTFAIVGVRQDVTVETSTDATLTDGEGRIVVSAFESDVTAVRAHARFALVVGRPVGSGGTPITPFATADWTSAGGGGEEGNGERAARASRSPRAASA